MSFWSPLRHPRFWKALSSPPGGGRGLRSSAHRRLSVPRNAFLRLCSPRCHCPSSLLRRVGGCPCQADPSASGTQRDRRLQGENAGLWRGLATGLLKGPRQSYGFITLPPCLRVSRNHSSRQDLLQARGERLELRRSVRIHIPAGSRFEEVVKVFETCYNSPQSFCVTWKMNVRDHFLGGCSARPW